MAHSSDGHNFKTDLASGAIFCVFVIYTKEHFDGVLSKSERITRGPLTDLWPRFLRAAITAYEFYLSSSCNSLEVQGFTGPWMAGTVNSLVARPTVEHLCTSVVEELIWLCKDLVNDQQHGQVLQTNVKDVA